MKKMIFKFIKSAIKANEYYAGTVIDCKMYDNNSTVRVFVELDDEPGERYMKMMQVSKKVHSQWGAFCTTMNIFVTRNEIDTDLLQGVRVLVLLTKGTDGQLYVKTIKPMSEDDEEEEEEYDYEEEE